MLQNNISDTVIWKYYTHCMSLPVTHGFEGSALVVRSTECHKEIIMVIKEDVNTIYGLLHNYLLLLTAVKG